MSEVGPSRTKSTRVKAEPHNVGATTGARGEVKGKGVKRRHSFELVVPVKRATRGKGKAREEPQDAEEDKEEAQEVVQEEEEVMEAMVVDEPVQEEEVPPATPATPPTSIMDAIRMSLPPATPTQAVFSPPRVKVPLAYSQSFGVSPIPDP